MDGWKMKFPFGKAYFQGRTVGFREGRLLGHAEKLDEKSSCCNVWFSEKTCRLRHQKVNGKEQTQSFCFFSSTTKPMKPTKPTKPMTELLQVIHRHLITTWMITLPRFRFTILGEKKKSAKSQRFASSMAGTYRDKQMSKKNDHFKPYCWWVRNHVPVDLENLPLFAGFYRSRVVQDFHHQQYELPALNEVFIGGEVWAHSPIKKWNIQTWICFFGIIQFS